jgi:hypothetical protein
VSGERGPPAIERVRHCRAELPTALATKARLEAYLADPQRPLGAMLSRDRWQEPAPGDFLYRSSSHRVLRWELTPLLGFQAVLEPDGQLRIRSHTCRLDGLGSWQDRLQFRMGALLQAQERAITARAVVGLVLRAPVPWALWDSVGALALEQVLDRLQRKVERGLRRDVLRWLETSTQDLLTEAGSKG